MKKIAHICALAGLLSCQACETLDFAGFIGVTGSAVEERFDASKKIFEKEPVADITVSSDEYRVVLVTDIHHDEDDKNLDRFISACIGETGTEKVVLCLGDIVNGRKGQSQVFSKLQKLSEEGWLFLNALGNHDTYFKEVEEFRKYWPLTAYTFNVVLPCGRKDLFICLDSADGAIGTSQRQWVEDVLKAASGKYRNIYVYTHTNFFNTDNTQLTSGNFSLEETYDLMSLFSSYGVKCVLTGHDHHFEECFFRGVTYYSFNALCLDSGSWYKLTFGDEFRFEECFVGR